MDSLDITITSSYDKIKVKDFISFTKGMFIEGTKLEVTIHIYEDEVELAYEAQVGILSLLKLQDKAPSLFMTNGGTDEERVKKVEKTLASIKSEIKLLMYNEYLKTV